MRKRLACLLILFVVVSMNIPAYSRAETGLNANERELIGYFQGGIDYEGKHYTIPSQYINQGINYLKQSDIQITDAQKQKVYQKVVEMTLEGIKQGYLVEDKDSTEVTPAPDASPQKENTGDGSTPVKPGAEGTKTPNAGLGTDKMSIPDLIGSVKDLSEELGVNISYDAQKKNVSVINENGKTVMLADRTIKNTGFRLNQTLGIMLGLVVLFGVSIEVARRNHLFAHDDET